MSIAFHCNTLACVMRCLFCTSKAVPLSYAWPFASMKFPISKPRLQDAADFFARNNMKKSLIAAIVLASASFGSSGVMAQDISSAPQAIDWTDFTAYFGDAFAEGNSGATFADRFTFTVDSTIGLNLDAIIGSASRSADVGLDITGLSLYDADETLITAGTLLEDGARDVWSLASDNLDAGDYYLQVSGSVVSDTAGSFGGAVMLAPVPEPETYGMLLGGLGVLGWLARRRKSGAQ